MLMQMHKTRIKGFTLVEILMVVAIIGILAAIALPSYQNSIRKSKRQAAISDMLLYKQAQERYRSTNLAYGSLALISGAPYGFTRSSSPSDYDFDIINVGATTYTIRAFPQGGQAAGAETSCSPLILDQNGDHGSNPASCWAK